MQKAERKRLLYVIASAQMSTKLQSGLATQRLPVRYAGSLITVKDEPVITCRCGQGLNFTMPKK